MTTWARGLYDTGGQYLGDWGFLAPHIHRCLATGEVVQFMVPRKPEAPTMDGVVPAETFMSQLYQAVRARSNDTYIVCLIGGDEAKDRLIAEIYGIDKRNLL